MTPRRVAYVHSAELLAAADRLPSNRGRASLVHELVVAFALLDESPETPANVAEIIVAVPASRQELCSYHDEDYVGMYQLDQLNSELISSKLDFILSNNGKSDSTQTSSDDEGDSDSEDGDSEYDEQGAKRRKLDDFGLLDDCPQFEGLSNYVRYVAGATLTACRALRDDRCDTAIVWTGGRHHAQRSSASGFCYVNDIVLGINELRRNPTPSPLPTNVRRKKLDKVIYIDLDIHHGDGVEAAFAGTKIRTLSIHCHAPLFFPSTGPTSGALNGPLNIAARPGLGDASLLRLVENVVLPVLATIEPEAVVIQLGVDGLVGDAVNEWNLSISGMGGALRMILLDACGNRKVLLLGGGGYHSANAARAWTYFTSIALDRALPLDSEIPPSVKDYRLFAPSFTLDVESGNRRDENSEEQLLEMESAFSAFRAS